MIVHSTNYKNTFIEAADDCPASIGEVPPLKGDKKTVANQQFEMLAHHPYAFTSDDVLFSVYADRNEIPEKDRKAARELFFSKGQPCMRASPLTKRYGWGIHNDERGKIALVARETPEYNQFANDKTMQVVKAMKSSR